jgi:hypothetical protein
MKTYVDPRFETNATNGMKEFRIVEVDEVRFWTLVGSEPPTLAIPERSDEAGLCGVIPSDHSEASMLERNSNA